MMMNLLMKLDRKAGRWLNVMDDNLQEPVNRVMTAAVFVEPRARDETEVSGHTSETPPPLAGPQHNPEQPPAPRPAPECKPYTLGYASD